MWSSILYVRGKIERPASVHAVAELKFGDVFGRHRHTLRSQSNSKKHQAISAMDRTQTRPRPNCAFR
jgi:hypothetical protein